MSEGSITKYRNSCERSELVRRARNLDRRFPSY
jgi:hypothetical protein